MTQFKTVTIESPRWVGSLSRDQISDKHDKKPHWAAYAVMVMIALYPLIYLGRFAGDAEIHLVYAEHAAMGHFFEFNLGEKSPGVTSSGYMLLLALLYLVLPVSYVPLAVKILCYVVWYVFIAITYRVARRVIGDHRWALIATLICGVLPGSAYNSVIGMENGIFGMMVILIFHLVLRWNDMRPTGHDYSVQRFIILGLILGCACWIRPEGFVISVIAFLYIIAEQHKRIGSLKTAFIQAVPMAVACGAFAIALIIFHFYETGHILPASGKARMISGSEHAITVGPISLDFVFSVRLAQYFPLTIMFLIGNVLILRRQIITSHTPMLFAFLSIFWVFFFLYSFVLGAAHFSRYVIFIMPYIVLIAVLASKYLLERFHGVDGTSVSRKLSVFFVLGGLALVIVFGAETFQRARLGNRKEVLRAMNAPRIRQACSDDLIRFLGDPEEKPISLLFQEVQVRYWLDRRFIIRSSDGRVDPVTLNFVHGSEIDHVGYIKERRIDYVMETQFENEKQEPWRISSLKQLGPGESVEQQGVRFSPVTNDDKLFFWDITRQPVYHVEFYY